MAIRPGEKPVLSPSTTLRINVIGENGPAAEAGVGGSFTHFIFHSIFQDNWNCFSETKTQKRLPKMSFSATFDIISLTFILTTLEVLVCQQMDARPCLQLPRL